MTKKGYPEKFKFIGIRIPIPYIERMKKIKKLQYISISEQIRIALRNQFKKNNV